jgi:exopolyphosphatase / guanosine-5'-triphosphate,3'-diphosphate pyrophosphatase
MQRYAVIDLGSNTFHLLIVEPVNDKKFCTIFRKRVFTGLSDGGIDYIKSDRIASGIETLTEFKNIITANHCTHLKVIGTAALRTASNRMDFIHQAENILGITIHVIDGMTEAEYIYRGITLLPEANTGTHLIMDIGGGSTEFIIIKDGEKMFSKSYVLGVGALHEIYHKSEPISLVEINAMTDHIQKTVSDLLPVLSKYPIDFLTGASGSFEVLQLMKGINPNEGEMTQMTLEEFHKIYHEIVSADEINRRKIKGLPPERIKLIVVGMVLKKTLIDLVHPKYIMVSPYSLKEGVIRQMMSQ